MVDVIDAAKARPYIDALSAVAADYHRDFTHAKRDGGNSWQECPLPRCVRLRGLIASFSPIEQEAVSAVTTLRALERRIAGAIIALESGNGVAKREDQSSVEISGIS